MAAQLRHFIKKYPIIPNALVYGTMVVGAEFSQQTLNKRYFVRFKRVFIILKPFSYKFGFDCLTFFLHHSDSNIYVNLFLIERGFHANLIEVSA